MQGNYFYAMSVYFFALDCMRELGPLDLDHWPAPSLHEVEEAAHHFCGMSWDALKADYEGVDRHAWTTPEQLSDRCFEVLYIITILEKGFGFDKFARSITFALEVGGKEVEWTLGFALAEVDFSPILVVQSELDYQLAHLGGMDRFHQVASEMARSLHGRIMTKLRRLMDSLSELFGQLACWYKSSNWRL